MANDTRRIKELESRVAAIEKIISQAQKAPKRPPKTAPAAADSKDK